jgi:hypothetical protein
MKLLKPVALIVVLTCLLVAPLRGYADDAAKKPKPYTLNYCVVSGDKFGGDMGKPVLYIYKDKKIKDDPGREIKFCCKDCRKDFDKDPAKFIKKIDEAEAKAVQK